MKVLFLVIALASFQLKAQELIFSSEVSTDNVTVDEVFELTFTIKDGSGDFTAPVLESFDIVGGPNVSSSIQITNGSMQQEKSYTYYIRAKYEGELVIESATLDTDEGILTTPEIIIFVGEGDGSNSGSTYKKQHQSKRKNKKDKKKKRKSIFKRSEIKKI